MISEADNSVIQIINLKKYFEGVKAVDDISFEVKRGEMFGFVGPDGAGKTTTIRCLCGLLTPNEGNIQVLGSDIKKNKKDIQNKIGYLSQKFSLYGDLSIDENIEFFAAIHNVRSYEDRRNQLLDFTRLTPFRKRIADKLSGGMKQKLALTCCLIHKPEIIFLDEPTTGVDPVSRRDFWKILSDLQKDGITIFMSTPYLDEAERCNRVALIDKGKIISLDTPQSVKESIGTKVIEVVTSKARDAYVLVKEKSDLEVQLFGDRINIMVDKFSEKSGGILSLLRDNNIPIEDHRSIDPSLENVFITLISKNLWENAQHRSK
jgi:ABC-2 type transport system ATP-binding protein